MHVIRDATIFIDNVPTSFTVPIKVPQLNSTYEINTYQSSTSVKVINDYDVLLTNLKSTYGSLVFSMIWVDWDNAKVCFHQQ